MSFSGMSSKQIGQSSPLGGRWKRSSWFLVQFGSTFLARIFVLTTMGCLTIFTTVFYELASLAHFQFDAVIGCFAAACTRGCFG
jgi:hypothetical protein